MLFSIRSTLVLCAGLAAGAAARLGQQSSETDDRVLRGSQIAAGGQTLPVQGKKQQPAAGEVIAAQGAGRLRLLLAWLPGADEAALERMADELVKDPDGGGDLSIRLLMARWAEVDPLALLAWAGRQPDSSRKNYQERESYEQNAMEAWARVDFDSAWAMAGANRMRTRPYVLLGLSAVDPEKCLRLLQSDPGLLKLEEMGKVLARLAGHDPAGAAALVGGLSTEQMAPLGGGIALAWIKQDAAACMTWLESLPDAARGHMAREAGIWLAGHAPGQLQSLLEKLPAGNDRTALVASAFDQLARRDPAAAQAQLATMPDGPARQNCRALLLKELVRSGDEAAAITLAGELGWTVSTLWSPDLVETNDRGGFSQGYSRVDGKMSRETLNAPHELMRRIAMKDPRQAAGILLAEGTLPEKAPVYDIASGNPEAVVSALMAHSDDSRTPELVRLIVSAWANTNPGAAAEWLGSARPQGMDRRQLESALIYGWGKSDPEAMVNWATLSGADTSKAAWTYLGLFHPDYTSHHLDGFFAAAPEEDIVGILLSKLPSAGQREILRRLPGESEANMKLPVTNWLNRNPEEASEWVRDLPEGPLRTGATTSLVQWLMSTSDYEAALQWSAGLPQAERAPVLEQTIPRLTPSVAADLIQKAGLPGAETSQWLQFIQSSNQPSQP